MESKTFTVTPAQFRALRIKLSEDHATQVFGDNTTGTITGHHVKANYRYDGDRLVVTVESHPFYIPIQVIFGGLQNALDAVDDAEEATPAPLVSGREVNQDSDVKRPPTDVAIPAAHATVDNTPALAATVAPVVPTLAPDPPPPAVDPKHNA